LPSTFRQLAVSKHAELFTHRRLETNIDEGAAYRTECTVFSRTRYCCQISVSACGSPEFPAPATPVQQRTGACNQCGEVFVERTIMHEVE